MTIDELRDSFSDELGRTDITEEQITRFFSFGIKRVQRNLKMDFQDTTAEFAGAEFIDLPDDYLSLITVKVNGKTYQRKPITHNGDTQDCDLYVVKDGQIWLPEVPNPEDTVEVRYHRNIPLDTTGEADYADSVPDLIFYAALIPAALFFQDERGASFDAMYGTILNDVLMDQSEKKMAGLDLRIRNPYEGYI